MLTLAFIFAAGVLAGAVDAVAGGSGLLMVPALMFSGLDPATALATNKLCNTSGSLTSVTRYARAGMVEWKIVRAALAPSLVAALAGCLLVGKLPPETLEPLVVGLLVAITLLTLLRPSLGSTPRRPRFSPELSTSLQVLVSTAVGFHDGFFGPGAGIMLTFSLVFLSGLDFLRATGTSKVINALTSSIALVFFLVQGRIDLGVGLVGTLGIVIGSFFGSGLATRNGARLVRPIFLGACAAIALKVVLAR